MSAPLRRRVYARDGKVCRYCGATSGPFQIDHVRPVSREGSSDLSNLVVACRACNRAKGAKLLTAEVLYYMPDHPKLLQTYLWQTLDMAPKYPRLQQFLEFWRREIDAVIHSVRVAHGQPLEPPQWRNARGLITMN